MTRGFTGINAVLLCAPRASVVQNIKSDNYRMKHYLAPGNNRQMQVNH